MHPAVKRTLVSIALLLTSCATWKAEVQPSDATPRTPLPPESKVVVSGSLPFAPTRLEYAADAACGIDEGASPSIAAAVKTIDWNEGVMTAAPLEHLGSVTLTHQHAIPTTDHVLLQSVITREARALGANVAAVRKTTSQNDQYYRTVEFFAYDVDCGAARAADTSTSTTAG